MKRHGIKLGFMSAFVKASAYALTQQPTINAVIDGSDIVYRDYVDISVAVATPKGLVVPVLRNVQDMDYADIEKGINALGLKAKNNQLSIEVNMIDPFFKVFFPEIVSRSLSLRCVISLPSFPLQFVSLPHCLDLRMVFTHATETNYFPILHTILSQDMDGGTFTISNGGVFGSLFGTPIINPPQSAILGMHGVFERPVARNGQVEHNNRTCYNNDLKSTIFFRW